MQKRQRPLSPHLQIYRPQLTSVLSIAHRLTGLLLFLGATLLVYWLGAVAAGIEAYEQTQTLWFSWYGRLLLFLFTYGLFYHLCNGIRHLFWDVVLGFEMKSVYRSGYLVIAVSALLTLGLWAYGYAVRGDGG
jgi:succinate dehydrogenase / fumarate reductase cytochrome b subunit